jgi:hypothetical protein
MLLCHIIGINNKSKIKFIDDIATISNDIIILDLDDISKKILFDNEYTKLYNQYMIKKDKQLLTKLGQIWKIKFTDNINILLDHNKDKQIILIGLITFYLDYRIKINLNEEIKDKFFINMNVDNYIKDNIEFNIDNFRDDIINGKFPLKYLDYEFIKSQREFLREQYIDRDYKLKNYDAIINWIKHKYNNNQTNPVYVASYNRYEDSYKIISDSVVGYSEKWLALVSLLSRNKLKRGITYKDNKLKPILKELVPNAFSDLNKCCYLYEFYPEKKVDDFRYLIDDKKFINRYYVSNINNELNLYDVTKLYYKS